MENQKKSKILSNSREKWQVQWGDVEIKVSSMDGGVAAWAVQDCLVDTCIVKQVQHTVKCEVCVLFIFSLLICRC